MFRRRFGIGTYFRTTAPNPSTADLEEQGNSAGFRCRDSNISGDHSFSRKKYSHFERKLDLGQLRHSACLDPFGNENIAVIVKACVMRMHELTVGPLVGLFAKLLNGFQSWPTIAQLGERLVLFVQNRQHAQ